MKVGSFIETLYHGLTQRGATMFVSKESIINFINFGLNDIYSFEGRGWSFMYRDAETISIPANHPDTFYTHTSAYPLYRIINIYDKKHSKFLDIATFRQTKLRIIKEGELYFLPFTTAVTIFNNEDGYDFAYLGWFVPVTENNDELPIPDAFTQVLYDFVMAYILPVYAQYGEQRENMSYQKAMSKLNELKKADDIQFNKISVNIK